jgi:hypothetical protein
MNNAKQKTKNFTSTSLTERHDIDHNNQEQKNYQTKHRCCISPISAFPLSDPSGLEYNISLFFCKEEVEGFSCVSIAFLFQCPRIYIDPTIGTYVLSQNKYMGI